jgi:DNA-binding FadR family transcriptional regulator
MKLTEARPSPSHIRLAKSLGVEIVTKAYPAGHAFPSEADLAEQYGISRNVVREALRILSAKGLLKSKPKTGTKVRDRADWNLLDPDLLAWMFEGQPPIGYIRGLFELRMIVEPAAAERAAERRTARHLSRMGHALEIMDAEGLGTEAGQSADQDFHAAILDATGNELLVSLTNSISAAVRWTTIFKFRASRKPRDMLPRHRDLFEAIAQGNAQAARKATETLIREAEKDTEAALLG